jgi:putative aldouronate transport system permease protein
MSKTKLKGYKFFINMIIFTMYFKGGLIPSYMLMRSLGLIDTYWAVILTGGISTYNMLVLRSFFLNIPGSLEEAAIIDGATEPYVLFKIILPISLPAIATIGLFYAVGHWNSYFTPLIYLNSRKKWPLQVILREILFESTESMRTMGEATELQKSAIGPQLKMATVIVTIIPITLVYPFLQKHFTKGVLIGAIKA